MLQHRADLMAKDGNGFTAMDIAEQNGHSEIMQLLKDAVGMCLALVFSPLSSAIDCIIECNNRLIRLESDLTLISITI